MWNWLKGLGKGARRAAPEVLDLASLAVPGPASRGMHEGAELIRRIQERKALESQVQGVQGTDQTSATIPPDIAREVLIALGRIEGVVPGANLGQQTRESQNARDNEAFKLAISKPVPTVSMPKPVIAPSLSPGTMLLVGNIQDRIRIAQEYKALLLEIVELESKLKGPDVSDSKTTGPVDSQPSESPEPVKPPTN